MKKILAIAFLSIACSSCYQTDNKNGIVENSCSDPSKSSTCGQKETTVPSELQMRQVCKGKNCETLNVDTQTIIFKDRETNKVLIGLGCREDLVELGESEWELIFKDKRFPKTFSFKKKNGATSATCGLFETEETTAYDLCNFIATHQKRPTSCKRECTTETYNLCFTSDSLFLNGASLVEKETYPFLETKE